MVLNSNRYRRRLNNLSLNDPQTKFTSVIILRIVLIVMALLVTGTFDYLKGSNICNVGTRSNLCREPNIEETNTDKLCANSKLISFNKKQSARNVNIMVIVGMSILFTGYVIYIVLLLNAGYGSRNSYYIIDIILLILTLVLMIYWGKYYKQCFNADYSCDLQFTEPQKVENPDGTTEFKVLPQCIPNFKNKLNTSTINKAEEYISVINTFILALLFALVMFEGIMLNGVGNILGKIFHGTFGLMFILSVIFFFIYANKKSTRNAKITMFSFAILYLLLNVGYYKL